MLGGNTFYAAIEKCRNLRYTGFIIIPGVCAGPPGQKTEEMYMGKKALITGVTGQDGSFLAELLLEK